MTKQELRNKIKQINLSSEYIKYSDEIIFNKLINLEVFKTCQILFIYVSRKNEVDTIRIIKYALDLGKTVCVPKCFDNFKMKSYEIKSIGDLEIGSFNILEPKSYLKEINKNEIDLAVVPCVTCDVDNNRLGYGKGFYDRFLTDTVMKKVCLCRKNVLQEKIPVDKNDVKMDIVLTD
jgi:5-formyltetrahydrofolate cyclo-ligase